MLNQEKLLPAKDKHKLEETPSTEYRHTKAQSTTAKLMSSELASDSAPIPKQVSNVNHTAANSANPTLENEEVSHPKPVQGKTLADDESKSIFKTPTLKPPGH